MPHISGVRQTHQRDTAFEADVRGRSWHWLFELCRRIGVDLLLVDTRGTLVVPPGADSRTSSLGTLLSAAPPALMSAIWESVRIKKPQFVSVESQRIVCAPLIVDELVRGVAVTARVVGAPAGAAREEALRAQLEAIGTRLAHTIETHLEQPPDTTDADLEQVVMFAQVLAEAHQSRSERELLLAFVQALSMWHEIECRMYLETAPGVFALDVSLPGTAWDPATMMLSLAASADGALTPLTHGEVDQLGLPADRDVVVTRIPRPDGRRIAVIRGDLTQREVSRVSVYLSLLGERLRHVETDNTLAALERISAHCRTEGMTAAEIARRVLNDVLAGTGGVWAVLDVTDVDGTRLLRVMAGESSLGPGDRSGTLEVSRTSADHRLTVAVASGSGSGLGPHTRAFLEAVADLLVSWERFTGRAGGQRDRRAASEPDDASFERLAHQALEHGEEITAVVVRVRPESQATAARQWVSQWRAHVRPADAVAMLRTDEIALLLRGSSSNDAQSIVDRLMRVAHIDRSQAGVSFGMSSHSPRARAPERVLALPRAQADAARPGSGERPEMLRHDG